MDREAKQLDLKRARSESQPSGGEGLRQERNPVEVTRREPVRQRKQKGKQNLGEQRTGSWQHRVAGREKTQTSVEACSESAKRQAMNESPPVTYLWLPPRQSWFCKPQEVLGTFDQYLCQFQILVDRLPESSGKVFYHFRQADLCHSDAMVRAWKRFDHGPLMTIAPGVHRNLESLFAHLVVNGKLSLKNLVELGLHCIVKILVSIGPIATLDHLREGGNLRCILPLPQPASLFVAKVVLCNLVASTQHVYHVEHLRAEAGQFSEWMTVTGIKFMYLSVGSNTPRLKMQHFCPAQQTNVNLVTNLKRFRLDYYGENQGQFLSMSILDENLLVTMSIEELTSAFNLNDLGDPCVPFQALGEPVPTTLAIPQIQKDRAFPAWHGNQGHGRFVNLCLECFTELKHWDDLVIGSFGQLQAVMQEGYKQWNIPRQEAKALTRLFAFEDLGCHNNRTFGAVLLQRQIDVNLGTATLCFLARSRPQQMNLWFAVSDRGLRMQFGAAFQKDLAGRLVHALLLMPFMIIDLHAPPNGTVVAIDTSVHGQGVCCTVGIAAAGELDAKSREAQHTQLWDNCIGLVVMLRSFTSWRGAFDELDIHPATVALVGRSPTSNTKISAARSVVIVFVSPSSLTSHWLKQVMDYTPNVTQWCHSKRNLEPAEANEFHLRNFILQHTSSVAVSYLVAAPVDFARKDVKTKLQYLETWPNLVCPFTQCDLSGSMLVWLSWYVIASDDQAGKPESFPSFTVRSISGVHHRQFRPDWTFAGDAGAKFTNFPLDSLPASTGLTCDATRDVQGSELCPFGFIGLHKVFTQQLFAPLVIMQKERNDAEAAGARSEDVVVERLGRVISTLQHHRSHRWKWATVISNRWNHADHDNSLFANTSRQSVFAYENAARRALAS